MLTPLGTVTGAVAGVSTPSVREVRDPARAGRRGRAAEDVGLKQVGLGAEGAVVAGHLDDVGAGRSGVVWMYWLWASGLLETASS